MINILANAYNIDADWCFETLQKYIKSDHKIAIIPFSFREEQINSEETWQEYYNDNSGLYYEGVTGAFERFGISKDHIKWVNYFSTSIEEARKIVLNADILYFTGGLPDKMMDRLREFQLVELIEKHEGIVLGFSAGALIQLENYHLTADKDYPCFVYNKGMKMISDFHIEVHFTKSELQMESIKKVTKETGKPVYAIEEEGAVIIDKGEVIIVGKVHCFQGGQHDGN